MKLANGYHEDDWHGGIRLVRRWLVAGLQMQFFFRGVIRGTCYLQNDQSLQGSSQICMMVSV